MGMLVIIKDWGVFQDTKETEAREKPYRKTWFSLLSTTLGYSFAFQQDNKLKQQGQIYTGIAYQEHSKCECEWLSYSFDLNLLENLWQDLKWLTNNDQQPI